MQASEEKENERDWYGYAKYLEARIDRAVAELNIIRLEISSHLLQSAEDSLNGKSSALQLCESLTAHRDIHNALINTGEKLRGIHHEFYNEQTAGANGEGDPDRVHAVGEVERESIPDSSECDRVSEPGRSRERSDHTGADSEERGAS